MPIQESIRNIQRFQYYQGQFLRSRDFRDQADSESNLRWWHNRALHNTYGVAQGLKVSPQPEQGPVVSLRITRGIAYDCFGRELILQQERDIPLPEGSVDNESILFIRYKEASEFPQTQNVSEICSHTETALLLEEPEFKWVEPERFSFRNGVPLAKINNERELVEDFSRPISRALARPHIASGTTIPGHTQWELWTEEIPSSSESMDIGFQVHIDTSAAGFTEVPLYFAQLQGTLWIDRPASRRLSTFISAPFGHIYKPTEKKFTFRLWMPVLNETNNRQTNLEFQVNFPILAQVQRLFVCWVGIQNNYEYSESQKETEK
jgi:hypothetical protein